MHLKGGQFQIIAYLSSLNWFLQNQSQYKSNNTSFLDVTTNVCQYKQNENKVTFFYYDAKIAVPFLTFVYDIWLCTQSYLR